MQHIPSTELPNKKKSADQTKFSLIPDKGLIQSLYHSEKQFLTATLASIKELLKKKINLQAVPTFKSRVKDFSGYYKKLLTQNMFTQETDALPLITDILGIRIVCAFLQDLLLVEQQISEHFTVLEVDRKGSGQTFREFGYESIHLLIKIPQDITQNLGVCGCEIAEIQIRTILQDAWAEVEHELVYKAEFNPFDDPMKRKLAAVNASLSLADIIFQEIRDLPAAA